MVTYGMTRDGDTSGVTCGPSPARHAGVAAFIVNNNPTTMKSPRSPFRTAAGWCFTCVPGAAQHEVVRCRPGTVPVCGGPGSAMHRFAGARAASHPGHTIRTVPVFSCFSADSESPIPGLTISSTHTHTPPRSRGPFLRPGFASLLHSPRIEGWAERRETFGCSAEHP